MSAIEREIARVLRAAGYPLVQTDAALPGVGLGQGGPRADVVAWEPDGGGELRPSLIVEVQSPNTPAERALPHLAMMRDLLGTRRHYVVSGDTWLEADAGIRKLRPVVGPPAPTADGSGILYDAALAEDLFLRQLMTVAARRRNEERRQGPLELFNELAQDTLDGQLHTDSGDVVTLARDVLWPAARRALDVYATRNKAESSMYLSDLTISEAVAALVGDRLRGTVSDPFCGAGGFLWSTADRAQREQRSVQLRGSDVQQQVIEVARTLSHMVAVPAELKLADAFQCLVVDDSDVVVTSPPFGMKLPHPYDLLSGATTRDADIAAVDRVVRALRPGGRAVLHLPNGFTFRSSVGPYRRFLINHLRVAAVIGLPPGAFPAASGVPTVLLVLDRADPGETFVAQLGNDWREQLTDTGAALEACLAHLDGLGAGA